MVVPEIGINFSAMANSPPPVPVWVNYTATEFINYVPENANTISGGYYGLFILLALAAFLFWLLTDRNEFGKFRYSIIRGFGISMGICLIFGIQLIQIGYISSLIHLGYFMGFFIWMMIYVLIKNPN